MDSNGTPMTARVCKLLIREGLDGGCRTLPRKLVGYGKGGR
jgi:hypothetical protein